MPIYDYACEDCDHEEAINHSFDEKIKFCPSCGSGEFKKLLSKFNTSSKPNPKNVAVGDLTKEYIEENRKVLEDQKKELRKSKS